MESEIIKIPLVYFDTNHIAEMVRWRKGQSKAPADKLTAYAAISKAVTSGYVKVLFSSASCLEWVEGQEDSTRWGELIEFFQTTNQEVLEVDVKLAFTLELIEETRRHFPKLSLPKVEVVGPVFSIPPELIALAQHHPDLVQLRDLQPIQSPGDKIGLQKWANGAARFSTSQRATMQERKDGWRDAMMTTRKYYLANEAKWMKQSGKMRWANDAQRLGTILSSSDPWIDQSKLADRIDFDRCPACSIYLNAVWLYAKNLPEKGPHDNDADDWLQIPAIAYAEYSLIEKTLSNLLCAGTTSLKSKVFSNPVKFAQHLKLL